MHRNKLGYLPLLFVIASGWSAESDVQMNDRAELKIAVAIDREKSKDNDVVLLVKFSSESLSRIDIVFLLNQKLILGDYFSLKVTGENGDLIRPKPAPPNTAGPFRVLVPLLVNASYELRIPLKEYYDFANLSKCKVKVLYKLTKREFRPAVPQDEAKDHSTYWCLGEYASNELALDCTK